MFGGDTAQNVVSLGRKAPPNGVPCERVAMLSPRASIRPNPGNEVHHLDAANRLRNRDEQIPEEVFV